MRKIIIYLLFLIFTQNLLADDIKNIYVNRTVFDIIDVKYTIPVNEAKSLIMRDLWRSTNGIVCSIDVITAKKPLYTQTSGTFECKTPEGYKAQIGFNCSQHTNRENSQYMFFGLVGKKENIGNFYVWCE